MRREREKKPMKQKVKWSNDGFSLVEVMVGVGLFAIALFGILSLLNFALAMNSFSENRTIAMNDTRRVLEEIRRVANADGLTTVTTTNWSTWATTNLADPAGSGNLSLDSEAVTVTDLQGISLVGNAADPLPVRVTMTWNEKQRPATYVVDTLITSRS